MENKIRPGGGEELDEGLGLKLWRGATKTKWGPLLSKGAKGGGSGVTCMQQGRKVESARLGYH